MKKKLSLLMLSVSMMSSAYAGTAESCPQANTKFLDVAKSYPACNSIVGGDSASCNNFCDNAEKLLGLGGAGGTLAVCTPDQIRIAQNEGRQQGMNEGRQQGRMRS